MSSNLLLKLATQTSGAYLGFICSPYPYGLTLQLFEKQRNQKKIHRGDIAWNHAVDSLSCVANLFAIRQYHLIPLFESNSSYHLFVKYVSNAMMAFGIATSITNYFRFKQFEKEQPLIQPDRASLSKKLYTYAKTGFFLTFATNFIMMGYSAIKTFEIQKTSAFAFLFLFIFNRSHKMQPIASAVLKTSRIILSNNKAEKVALGLWLALDAYQLWNTKVVPPIRAHKLDVN